MTRLLHLLPGHWPCIGKALLVTRPSRCSLPSFEAGAVRVLSVRLLMYGARLAVFATLRRVRLQLSISVSDPLGVVHE